MVWEGEGGWEEGVVWVCVGEWFDCEWVWDCGDELYWGEVCWKGKFVWEGLVWVVCWEEFDGGCF